MTLRRILPALLALALIGAALLAYATTRPDTEGVKLGANGCPAGYLNRAEREALERRERASQRTRATAGKAAREAEEEESSATGPVCVNRKGPEPVAELLAVQTNDAVRSTGGVAETIKPGAYRAAVADQRRIAARSGDLPGSAGEWKPAGQGPLISDDPRFGEVNGLGLADLGGRISDFARAPDGRIFAAVGEGGVWQSDDEGASWRSIGDPLPTQAVGAIGFSPANGGTLIVTTGDSVFGGGGTFAGLGAFRTTDGGKTWQKSTGIPDNVISFRVAVDPTNPQIVYAATGAGLFRSDDAGASFNNVNLPTDDGVADGQPKCKGAEYGREGCFLANMVTDVEIQTPGGSTNIEPNPKGNRVIAAVGWRGGNKLNSSANFEEFEESPNNGLYVSDTGQIDSFEFLRQPTGFTPQTEVGRVEFGSATGEEQDHNVLYAIVEDSNRFNGETPGIDAPGSTGLIPGVVTVLDGIYASTDFGQSWQLLADAAELQSPTTGSALVGTFQAAGQYGPGIQSWYNEWIEPDPTRQDANGIPTRLLFGLEEIWQNDVLPTGASTTATTFKVVGRYFGGDTCLALTSPTGETCPTDREPREEGSKTTHPDHHAALFVPKPDGGVRLLVGHDGGVNVQDRAAADTDFSNNAWGRGANAGFYTLLPYDAQVAKDNTIYAGLQDNGELKIQPDGKQFMTFGGDGAFSAVDPDDSKITYEGLPGGTINKSTNGGESYEDVTPPGGDSYIFINPFTMDPLSSKHLITAGNHVAETDDAAGSWNEEIFSFGEAPSGATYQMSAIDTRTVLTGGGGGGGGGGKKTADVPEYEAGGDTVPDPVNPTVGTGVDTPGSVHDQPFTIKPDEANASATIDITWDDSTNDWDLTVLKHEGEELVEIGSSAQGGTTEEQVVLTQPKAGDYVVRVKNFAATGTFKGKVTFVAGLGTEVGDASASYVAFCGFCDQLNDETRPFDNGIATNVKADGTPGKKLSAEGWHRAKAQGLPKRYLTSIQVDPVDPATVYVTVAGYSRRWLPVGVLGETADVSKGNVFKSTDAGETFKNISGNLPDVPANWTVVRNGQLVVATNVGTFISKDTDGGTYEQLGTGLPTAPTFTLELKPKATPGEPDTLIAATQGRGVYRYEFKDPVKTAPPNMGGDGQDKGQPQPQPSPSPQPKDTTPSACASSRAFRFVRLTPRSNGQKLKIGFSRRFALPVDVDVFRVSRGRTRVLKARRVARFTKRKRAFTWNGRRNVGGSRARLGRGYYFVRYTMVRNGKRIGGRSLVFERKAGKFRRRGGFVRNDFCKLLVRYRLERPVFGGTKRVPLRLTYRLAARSRVRVTVSRAGKVVKRFRRTARAEKTYRIKLSTRKLKRRGEYKVRLTARSAKRRDGRTLTARRL